MRRELVRIFGDRVNFDKAERMVYSHDVVNLPGALEEIILRTADAVVQPETMQEITELVRFAQAKKIPLTPRGAGTSGYGGVIPVKNGIVVSFARMNRIKHIDQEQMTVTFEPGVIWAGLEEELNRQGLALRLYPSSAPAATVGGWVGEGGSGIGSYEYGYFSDNIAEVKVITPDGRLQTFCGDDLAVVNRAEGITGFILEVTLYVRRFDEEKKILAAFADFPSLIQTIKEINEAGLPIWHLNFSTANFNTNRAAAVELTANKTANRGWDGVQDTMQVPKDHHLLLVVYPGQRNPEIICKLPKIIDQNSGLVLAEKTAEYEWAERFYPMRMKNLGPSLIPSEAVIPLDSAVQVVKEADSMLEGISIEGSIVSKKSIALLAFLTGDERTAAYNVGFIKSLLLLDIAKKYGGQVYSVGLYFTDAAEEALGTENLKRISDFKKQTDPDNIFNPGKIISNSGRPVLLRAAMRTAQFSKPLLFSAEKLLSSKPKVKRELVDKIARAAFACAQCGYCTETCTLYMGYNWESASPRGKWYLLRQYLKGNFELTQQFVNKLLMCTTCKRCNPVCQVGLPVMELWDELRPVLVNEMGFATYNAFEMMGESVHSDLNIWAGRRSERADWIPAGIETAEKAETAYWAGCTASFVTTDTATNAAHILREGGVTFCTLGLDEGCCGTPMLVAGKLDTFEFVFRNNMEGLLSRGVKEIIISCPGCYMAFAHAYPVWARRFGYPYTFQLKHISEKAEELINNGKLKFKRPVPKQVTWHDSCHIGRHSGIYDAPRNVLKSIPGLKIIEMPHNRENALCCGSVLTRIGDPPVADKLGEMRLQEAVDVQADALLATCPCCEVQLRASAMHKGIEMPVLDFTNFIIEALGYESKDSSDFTLYMWGVFAKAMEIMTVDGIVEMMSDMMPEIMAAMPPAMQPMMKGMEALPGPVQSPALNMMEKIIPILMPKLLPSMMPKLMPKVLQLMKEYIPDMPVQMEEKLPSLLPAVMKKIMPAMLPEVAPRLAPRMTDYMRN